MAPPLPASAVPAPHPTAPQGRVVPFPKPYRPPPTLRERAQIDAVQFSRRARVPRRRLLGEILLDQAAIGPAALARALDLQARYGGRLGEVLLAEGLIDEATLMRALAEGSGMGFLSNLPPLDAVGVELARRLPTHLAVEHQALPIRRIGGHTLVATARPETVEALRRAIPEDLQPCRFAIATADDIEARLARAIGPELARRAECRPPRRQSCRDWQRSPAGALVLVLIASSLAGFLLAPLTALQTATMMGLAAMAINLTLRLFALAARRGAEEVRFTSRRSRKLPSAPVPIISILVPLHREPQILPHLIERMARLDYPRSALDLLLVIEEGDSITRDALARQTLPPWIRAIIVPDGQPRTKPRALNYALNFARGRIVGIYDAEDAPEPDQLVRMVARFATASPDLACLQGQLDYYNPTRNWMARCFTVEYANWFRLVLPGLARMGLVVPLGGTTLFFRRAALEACGGWDAHNVTEDADLGVRLVRMGYRTEILQTTTFEEANAAPLAWVRQRSRWMKGYIMTWAVHSADPARLMRELGPKRFWGFQAHFLGSILNAMFLPFMWSTLVLTFGWYHPIADGLPPGVLPALAWSMPCLTLLHWAIAWQGCRETRHRPLRRWIPVMELYYPLATLAVGKALLELVIRPFHWDKTAHGAFGGTEVAEMRLGGPQTPGASPDLKVTRHFARAG